MPAGQPAGKPARGQHLSAMWGPQADAAEASHDHDGTCHDHDGTQKDSHSCRFHCASARHARHAPKNTHQQRMISEPPEESGRNMFVLRAETCAQPCAERGSRCADSQSCGSGCGHKPGRGHKAGHEKGRGEALSRKLVRLHQPRILMF